jgi:hypothetical protein
VAEGTVVRQPVVRKLLATVDEDFEEIDRLVRQLRKRIAVAAETIRIAAEKTPKTDRRRGKRRT